MVPNKYWVTIIRAYDSAQSEKYGSCYIWYLSFPGKHTQVNNKVTNYLTLLVQTSSDYWKLFTPSQKT